MQGLYRIHVGDQTYEYKNLITDSGKLALLKAIAGKRTGWASSIVVGIGSAAATSADQSLQFTVSGAELNLAIVDPVNEKVFFKTSLPAVDDYSFYELGCHAGNFTTAQRSVETGGTLLMVFLTTAPWIDEIGTFVADTVHNRMGADSISYNILASATAKGGLNVVNDFSQLPASTKFKLAYYTSNISDLILRLKTDASNYYSCNTWTVTNGYNIDSAAKSDFVATGSPDWANIRFLEIEAIATGSAGVVSLDAFRYDLVGTSNEGLLSRVVISPAAVKSPGLPMDVEYELDLDI